MGPVKLLNLFVERTDAVDKPATGRKFLIMKSEDAPMILKAAEGDHEELQNAARELANAAYETCLSLAEEKELHVAQPVVDALNKLAELVDFPAKFSGKEIAEDPNQPPAPGQRGVDVPRPGPGGNVPPMPSLPQAQGQKPPVSAAAPPKPGEKPPVAMTPTPKAPAGPPMPPVNQVPAPSPVAPRPDAAGEEAHEEDEDEQLDQLKELVETLQSIIDELSEDMPGEAGPGGGAQGIGMREAAPRVRLAAVGKAFAAVTKSLEITNLAIALRKDRTKLKIEHTEGDVADEPPSASIKIKVPMPGASVDKAQMIAVPEHGKEYDYDKEAAMLEQPKAKAEDAKDQAKNDKKDAKEQAKDAKDAAKDKEDALIDCPTCDGEGTIRDGNMTCPTCDGEAKIEPDELEKQKVRTKAMVARRKARQAMVEAREKAVWSGAFVNDLPDSSFAYIEPGGEKDSDGKTAPRSLRHLPYKGADGKPDAAHVRNALARLNQTDISAEAKASAKGKLDAAAKTLGIGETNKGTDKIGTTPGGETWPPKVPSDTPTSNIDPEDLPMWVGLALAVDGK